MAEDGTTDDLLTDVARTPPSACPYCDHVLNAVTTVKLGDIGRVAIPKPGDFTVCLHCAQLLAFDDRLNVRKPTDDDMARLRADEALFLKMEFMAFVARSMDRRPPSEMSRQERRARERKKSRRK
jgi:hypothetical protein